MEGVTDPDIKIGAVPPPVLPVEKKVTVPLPPVPAGKSICAAGDITPVEAVVHPVDLATFTRAYEV